MGLVNSIVFVTVVLFSVSFYFVTVRVCSILVFLVYGLYLGMWWWYVYSRLLWVKLFCIVGDGRSAYFVFIVMDYSVQVTV